MLKQSQTDKTNENPEIISFDGVDFNELDHATALQALIFHLECGNKLTFAEQCVLFMVVLAQGGCYLTKEALAPIIGNTEIWSEIQPLLMGMYEKAPGIDVLNTPSLFDEKFIEDCQRESKKAKDRIQKLTKTYIVRKRNTKEVKIGKSIQIKHRIRTLETQTGSKLEILALIPKDIESMLHKQFSEFRTIGEWFDDSKGLIEAFAKKQGMQVAI